MKAKRMERLIKCYSVSLIISCRNRSREKRQKSNGLKERKKCHKITTLRIHLLWRRNQMVESFSYIRCRNRSQEKKSNGHEQRNVRKSLHKESNFYEGEKDGEINQMVKSFSYINCNFPSTHIAPVWYTFYLLHFLHFTFSFMHWHFLYIWCFLQPYIVQIVHCPEDHRPKTLCCYFDYCPRRNQCNKRLLVPI